MAKELELFGEDLGNELTVRAHWAVQADGKRDEHKVLVVDVEHKGTEGKVVLNEDLDWPEDGVEWDVCPSEWESFESDIQDWVNETF